MTDIWLRITSINIFLFTVIVVCSPSVSSVPPIPNEVNKLRQELTQMMIEKEVMHNEIQQLKDIVSQLMAERASAPPSGSSQSQQGLSDPPPDLHILA